MALPDTTPVTSAVTQAVNWLDFSNPQTLTTLVLVGVIVVLIIKIIWDTYKDITGQRVIEQDGGILTIARVKNDAINNSILTVGNRSYAIDHPPYRIVTTWGVNLTIWLADKVTGRTIGLNDPSFKVMSADEQKEIIRAIPEAKLGTVTDDKGLTFLFLAIGAGAFLGYILRGFIGG